MSDAHDILDDILALCERAGVPHSTFGQRATNDPSLITRMAGRKALGRERLVTPDSEVRIRAAMTAIADEYEAKVRAAYSELDRECVR